MSFQTSAPDRVLHNLGFDSDVYSTLAGNAVLIGNDIWDHNLGYTSGLVDVLRNYLTNVFASQSIIKKVSIPGVDEGPRLATEGILKSLEGKRVAALDGGLGQALRGASCHSSYAL